MNLRSQDYLAKLLAKENLEVRHGNFQTASFDVVNRVLNLPLWADKGKDVNDLLVGHEVGHALYTPAEGWHDSDKIIPGVPKDMINIIEDIRIEKMIQRTYPGIVRAFRKGYKVLFDDNLFGTVGKDLSKYNFMDKLNIHSKGRGYAEVAFDDTEQRFLDLAMGVETWDDVLKACQDINDWLKNKEDYEDKETETTTVGSTGAQQDGDGQEVEINNESGEDDATDEGQEVESPALGGDGVKSLTDEAQRNNEASLLDRDETGKQPLYSSGISDAKCKELIISYDKLYSARMEKDHYGDCLYTDPALMGMYNEMLKGGVTKTVNLMAKEFERKKQAFEYARSSESKKGSLNMTKLHQYQYSEDIFLSVQQMAQAKSHGIFMILDFSGSMNTILGDVIRQTITIALFCRKVNIPFEAYSFTSKFAEFNLDAIPDESNGLERIDGVKLVNIISSTLNKTKFNDSLRHLFAVDKQRDWSTTLQGRPCEFDRLGSTPLIQSLIILEHVIKKFKAKTGVQNMNVMILTDGASDTLMINNTHKAPDNVNRNHVKIKFGRQTIEGYTTSELLLSAIKAVGISTRSKMLGFFLASSKRDLRYAYSAVEGLSNNVNRLDVEKAFNKDGVVTVKNTGGYDEFFVVKVGGRKAPTEFEVTTKNDKPTEIKDVKREFRKFNRNLNKSKMLVNKITDAVAA